MILIACFLVNPQSKSLAFHVTSDSACPATAAAICALSSGSGPSTSAISPRQLSGLGSAARRQPGRRIWPLKCGNGSDPDTPRVYLGTGVAAGQRVGGASPTTWCLLQTDG